MPLKLIFELKDNEKVFHKLTTECFRSQACKTSRFLYCS